jgi:hypothetical protein
MKGIFENKNYINRPRGWDSMVGIVTHYGLDGPWIESRWGRDFPHLSRPTLGPNQPPIQWVPGLSWG